MELPVSSGFLDNLLVTPAGDLALVECKLWRNPEARREVVGQIIDYASEIAKWTYERLQEAIRRTKALGGAGVKETRSLYQMVSAEGELDEASFVDRVSRNLRLGRFLLLVLGDGIQEGVESMTEFLQQHAGLHFTLGLVELALFELPENGYIVQPRVLARTTNIYRGIVRIEDGRIAVGPVMESAAASPAPGRPTTITKEQYFEQLERRFPGISPKLDAFIEKLPEQGIAAEFGTKSMILRWYADDATSWNLSTVPGSGDLWEDQVIKRAGELGHPELSQQYLESLAAIVPGAMVKKTPKPAGWYVSLDGHNLGIGKLLENETRANQWLEAIAEFQAGIVEATRVR